VDRDVTFVAVRLRWEDDPGDLPAGVKPRRPPFPAELLLSENEPADPRGFFRCGKFRLRKYESYLDLTLTARPGKDPAETAARWREQVRKLVAREWEVIHAYFQYRWEAYQQTHPGRPLPKQFVLEVRRYHIPEPGGPPADWLVPDSYPLARWRPGVPASSVHEQMEWYSPAAGDVLARLGVNPQVPALVAGWPLPGRPLSLALGGFYQRHFGKGHFEKLAR